MDDMNSFSAELLDVVVATDGSADADLAVDWAAQEATRRTGSLLILHAYTSNNPGHDAGRAALDIVDLAADRVRRHFPSLCVETKVVESDPRDALEEYQDRAAAVVLGSRGVNAPRTVWLGSVSYWATRHLHVPTVIVRPLPGASHRAEHGIVVGVDAGDSGVALRTAFEMAAHHGCSVTVAHAWWDVGGPDAPWSSVDPADVALGRRELVSDLLQDIVGEYPDVPFAVVFGRGNVVAFLQDLARSHEALVVGRKNSSPFDDRGLGTVASAVIEHGRGVTVVAPDAREIAKGASR